MVVQPFVVRYYRSMKLQRARRGRGVRGVIARWPDDGCTLAFQVQYGCRNKKISCIRICGVIDGIRPDPHGWLFILTTATIKKKQVSCSRPPETETARGAGAPPKRTPLFVHV